MEQLQNFRFQNCITTANLRGVRVVVVVVAQL